MCVFQENVLSQAKANPCCLNSRWREFSPTEHACTHKIKQVSLQKHFRSCCHADIMLTKGHCKSIPQHSLLIDKVGTFSHLITSIIKSLSTEIANDYCSNTTHHEPHQVSSTFGCLTGVGPTLVRPQ